MKQLKDFINESKKLDKSFLQKAIDSMLNNNDDIIDDIFQELKKSKSIYQALDVTDSWDMVFDEIDMINSQVSLGTTVDEIKDMTQQYDHQISKYICKTWNKYLINL